MPFSVEIIDDKNETLEELEFSSGVFGYWQERGRALALPALTRIYDDAFYTGADFAGQELAELLDECERLKKIMEEEGEAREIQYPEPGMVIRSNLIALDEFIAGISRALEEQGAVQIC